MKNKFYSLKKRGINFSVFVLLFMTISSSYGQTIISSVAELADVVGESNQNIVMQAGVYDIGDYLTPANIDSKTPEDAYNRKAMMRFSGSNNTFDFTGVTINIPTSLLSYIGRGTEFQLTGSNINLKGLTLTNTGNSLPANPGITLMTVTGDYNTLENVTLNVAGSSPYGYGDLLGKGGKKLVGMKKHSGMIIEGLDCKFLGCSVYSEAFGHLIAIQGGRNVYFQDCHVEAVTRTTDEMLAETSGLAFGVNFASVWPNYDGEEVITPGYTKCLSEDGYRTYGSGATGVNTSGVTLVNCTAKNARVGFALEYGGPILIQNCEATGCEGGYNVTDATIENSRGDAVNGPLLYLTGGSNSNIELALMSTLPTTTLHAIATIVGDNHNVTLTKWENQTRTQNHKILLGATRPTAVNPFSPLGTGSASGVTLNNCTGMPIEVYSTVSSSTVNSNGTVDNNGSNNTISNSTDCEDVSGCNNTTALIEAECYDNMFGIEKEASSEGTDNIGFIEDGDWTSYSGINLGTINTFNARVASENSGTIEVRLDALDGELLTTISVASTGDWQNWTTVSESFNPVGGIHDIYLVFKGGTNYLFNVNWVGFTEEVVPLDCNGYVNGVASIDACGICSGGNTGIEVDLCLQCGDPWATSIDGENIAANVLDDNLDTRWSGKGIGEYIELCVGDDPIILESIDVSFFNGDIRTTTFDIQVSLDGFNWTTVSTDAVSSGTTLEKENFTFLESEAWKIRLVGKGNSINDWNSVTELSWNEVITSTSSYDYINSINVFPNPSSDYVTIESRKKIIAVNVLNVMGHNVLDIKTIEESGLKLDVSALSQGIYLMEVILEDDTSVIRKFTKE